MHWTGDVAGEFEGLESMSESEVTGVLQLAPQWHSNDGGWDLSWNAQGSSDNVWLGNRGLGLVHRQVFIFIVFSDYCLIAHFSTSWNHIPKCWKKTLSHCWTSHSSLCRTAGHLLTWRQIIIVSSVPEYHFYFTASFNYRVIALCACIMCVGWGVGCGGAVLIYWALCVTFCLYEKCHTNKVWLIDRLKGLKLCFLCFIVCGWQLLRVIHFLEPQA